MKKLLGLAVVGLLMFGCEKPEALEKPFYQDKEIKVISRRCDPSGCLDKVEFKGDRTPAFEVSPERIEWK